MATYYGNKDYPKEFKQWINNWLDDNDYKKYFRAFRRELL